MDVFDPNILQRVFLEAILQVGIKKSIGDLGPECPFNIHMKWSQCWGVLEGEVTEVHVQIMKDTRSHMELRHSVEPKNVPKGTN